MNEFRRRLILQEQPGNWQCNKCRASGNDDYGTKGRGVILDGNEDADTLRYRICTLCSRWRVTGQPKRGYCIDCVDERERWVRQTDAWNDEYVTDKCLGCRRSKTVIQRELNDSDTESAGEAGASSDRQGSSTTSQLPPKRLSMEQGSADAVSGLRGMRMQHDETKWERHHVVTSSHEARRRAAHIEWTSRKSPRDYVHYAQLCQCVICDRTRKETPNGVDAPETLMSPGLPFYWHATHDCRCLLCQEIHWAITPLHVQHLSTLRYEQIATSTTDGFSSQPRIIYSSHIFATCLCEFCSEGRRRHEQWDNSGASLSIKSVDRG